jgi:hypothetical protein
MVYEDFIIIDVNRTIGLGAGRCGGSPRLGKHGILAGALTSAINLEREKGCGAQNRLTFASIGST